MKTYLVAAVMLLLLAACGKSTSSSVPPVTGNPKTLLVFSAPWCEACEHEVPAIDTYLKTKTQHDAFLYVETAAIPSHPPDPAALAHYSKDLGVTMPVIADPWRWKTYRKYFVAGEQWLPMAIVLNEQGQVIHKLGPKDLADAVRRVLK